MKKTLFTCRKDFPIFEEHPSLIYLDSAATAQKPQVVLDALHRFYSSSYGTVHRGVYTLSKESTEKYEGARGLVQKFLNARSREEIILTRGTTHSLNLLARSFPKAFLKKGDTILLTEIEHHANLVPWQMVAEERGIRLCFIPVDDGGKILYERYLKLLQEENVKLVSVHHLSNVLGVVQPVKEMIQDAHRRGAYACVDGAQAAAHLPIDVQDLDVDFYAFSGHKLYGPTGVGVLYGKKELMEKMPPVEGGGDMVERVTLEKSTFGKLPLKFEAGTPMIGEVIGLGAALDFLMQIGMERVSDHAKALTAYAEEKLNCLDEIQLLGPPGEKEGIISFTAKDIHSFDLASFLDCKNIAIRSGHHCSQPTMAKLQLTATCRISFGLYNTYEDIDLFIKALREVIDLLK